MPKETFKDWKTGERTLFELRWAKADDVDRGRAVMYFPPLPVETPDGVFEMIGNDGDVTEINRLIEALRRAKRALLGTSSAVDGFVDYLPDAVKQGKVTSEEAARAEELALKSPLNNGIVFVPDTGPAVLLEGRSEEKFPKEQKHNPTDICPVSGCNCDLDYRAAQSDSLPSREALAEAIRTPDGHELDSLGLAADRVLALLRK